MAVRSTKRLRSRPSETRWWAWSRFVAANAAGLSIILRIGWQEPLISANVLIGAEVVGLIVYALLLIVPSRLAGRSISSMIRGHLFETVTLCLAAVFFWSPAMLSLAVGLLVLHQLLEVYLAIVQTEIPTGLLFVGSFVVLIAVGTAGLLLPAATPTDAPISVLDAAFTITSAISQTGLVVRPTGEGFTRFGQVIILIWIQVGALGVIVFGALLAQVIGSSFGLRATQTMAESTEQGWTGQLSIQRLVVFIIVLTHVIEAIGALVFFIGWPENWPGSPWDGDPTHTPLDRLYHAVFFSISSFCNAGFATTSNSMQGLRFHWTSHIVIVGLIVFGSIGFPVLDNIRQVFWARVRGIVAHKGSLIRLNLNTKIVLSATLAVYVFGYLAIMLGESTQTAEPIGAVALDAHFMTINRTSGFDTIAPQDMGLLSRLTLILLMFIGGSPASVAGGIKMMVFAVLALTVWSTLRGKPRVEAFGRTIPDELVRKSATLIVMSLVAVMLVTGVLVATESNGDSPTLGPYLFEATSAFGTTGLSMGITPELGPAGKGAIMVAMFFGRVGPLAVMAALFAIGRARRPSYEYPTEEVVIY